MAGAVTRSMVALQVLLGRLGPWMTGPHGSWQYEGGMVAARRRMESLREVGNPMLRYFVASVHWSLRLVVETAKA